MENSINLLNARIEELENENAILKSQHVETLQAKELYLKIFEDFPALIWRARLDKLCDYFNKTWLEFTGRTMEQEFGNGWAEGVHPDDFDNCLHTFVTSFDKRESFLMEYRMKNKLGEYRWIRDFGRPFYDVDDTFLGYIGSCYDVTESKEAEITIKQQNEELQKLNNAKDLYFSIISHDLKSPFNALLGFSTLLCENIRNYDIETIESFIKDISNISQNTYNLLEELLLWANAQSGKIKFKPEIINLKDICDEVIELVTIKAKEKNIAITLSSTINQDLFVDIQMVKTIMRNIITNALKFTNSGGEITISAKKNTDFIQISIIDNGVGISSEQLSHLFDISKAQSTPGTSDEKGTGLGLIICKEFIEKHNGTIEVYSELGKGSEFIFSLPIK